MNKTLAKFLVANKRPKQTMNYPTLHGFLFVIACSPEMIASNQWLPYVFNHSDPAYKNQNQKHQIETAIQQELDAINSQINEESLHFPAVFQAAEQTMDNFAEDAFHAHWGRGVVFGHNILSELWNSYLPEEVRTQQQLCLNTLTFFSDKNHAKLIVQGMKIENLDLETMAESVLDNFELAMNRYADISLALRSAIDDYGTQHPNA